MLCTEAPEKVPSTVLRWSIYTVPMGALCVYAGMTDPIFALDSLPLNGYLLYHAYNFYKDNSNANARKLFFATLAFLPLFMVKSCLLLESNVLTAFDDVS
jgi:heme O synthase-like polyprenyltransferase